MASTTQHSNSWWSQRKDQSLQARIKAIQKINDPTTNADEILTGSKVLIFILLVFTGLLGGISYYKNFSTSFPVEAAIAMALTLTITIEWGKTYAATWALRIPFFRGWGHIRQTAANTFIFTGLISFAIATFAMSVYNSTEGGEQLSRMLSHERHQEVFQPNTQAIDAQIATLSDGIEKNRQIQWKGTTTRTAQKAINQSTEAIASLQRQREEAVAQQRADWEKNQTVISEQSNFAARLVLASGGWVEMLQILLILLRVSCERSLDSNHVPTPSNGIGYQRHNYANGAPAASNQYNLPTDNDRVRIQGFRRSQNRPPEQHTETPVPDRSVPNEIAGEQCSTKEQQHATVLEQPTVPVTKTAVLADIKYWEKRAHQCYGRSFTQQSEEKRRDNADRCQAFCHMLQAVGVQVIRDDARLLLEFQHPTTYNTSDAAIERIVEQQQILEQIKNRK